jgi:hypothetical protein
MREGPSGFRADRRLLHGGGLLSVRRAGFVPRNAWIAHVLASVLILVGGSSFSTRALASPAHAAQPLALLPPIVDDAALSSAVEIARTRFLARQPFERFDVTVLVADREGRWRRGAHGGDVPSYPASCVKLAYLVAAIQWCTERGRAPECLDADVRPMIVQSDNHATGRVVDAITGAPNVAWPATDGLPLPTGTSLGPSAAPGAVELPPDFAAWLGARRRTSQLLEARGLLGTQRLLHKTWPTNSGESPAGFERLALALEGRNAMTPNDAARLMLAIESGAIVPEGREYARSLLRRARWSAHGAFGSGLPPGTRYDAKIGSAYDTLEEIAWLELPDGRRLVVAGFSNGWRQDEPPPFDVATLGSFVEELIAVLGAASDPARARSMPWSTIAQAKPAPPWTPLDARGAREPGSAWANARTDATYEWRVRVPHPGRYEVAAWLPAAADLSAAARYEIEGHELPVWIDQRRWGARWLPVGAVESHDGFVVVRVSSDAEEGRLVADAIRVTALSGR